MGVSAKLRRAVTERAANRCEYCCLSADGQAATFHIDHVLPQVAGGQTTLENLALACVHCSLRKGAKRTAIDPRTGKMIKLFSPRNDSWSSHFRWDGVKVLGKTAVGRATTIALDLNNSSHLIIRGFESRLQRHPPPLR